MSAAKSDTAVSDRGYNKPSAHAETFFPFRSRSRCAFLAPMDATLEGSFNNDWSRRGLRLSLHARKSEAARPLAATRGGPSAGAGRRATRGGWPDNPDRQEHGWPYRMSCCPGRKGGRPRLPWIPAVRCRGSSKTSRRSSARLADTDPVRARNPRFTLSIGYP